MVQWHPTGAINQCVYTPGIKIAGIIQLDFKQGGAIAIVAELKLGKNCFGISAWEDTFYRDMRFVKQAFEAAGYQLLYSRKKEEPGYYLEGQPALSSEIQQVLKGSAAEVNQRQIDIYRNLSFAERFHQGCSISDTARTVVAYRIRQNNPKLSLMEANHIALQRAYSK